MPLESELRKGSTPVLILALLAERPMYGYLLAKELERRSDGYFDFKEGTLYTALHKMEQEGLVQGEWEVVENGPSRKYYHLTEKGQCVLAESTQECVTFAKRLLALLGSQRQLQPGEAGA